jgi:hypothetical protein
VIVGPARAGFTVAFRLAANDVTLRGVVIQAASVGIDASDAFSGYHVTQNRIENSSLFAIDAGSSGAKPSHAGSPPARSPSPTPASSTPSQTRAASP